MSYDLYFYGKTPEAEPKKGLSGIVKGIVGQSDEKVRDKAMLEFLSSFGNVPGPELCSDGFDAGYLNEKTGTHVVFSMHRKTIPDIESDHQYAGYAYTGLSVILNYNRPHYFMHEAAPMIEAFSTKFDLLVYDPQDSEELTTCTTEDLIRSYDTANSSISSHTLSKSGGTLITHVSSGPVPVMSRAASHEFWEYMYNREKIIEWMIDRDLELYAPDLMVLRNPKDGSFHRTIVLTDGVGYLVPSCDAVLVDPNSRKPGIVQGKLLMERLSGLLHPVTILGREYLSLSIADSKSLSKKIHDLPRQNPSDFERFQPGMWLDPQ